MKMVSCGMNKWSFMEMIGFQSLMTSQILRPILTQK